MRYNIAHNPELFHKIKMNKDEKPAKVIIESSQQKTRHILNLADKIIKKNKSVFDYLKDK